MLSEVFVSPVECQQVLNSRLRTGIVKVTLINVTLTIDSPFAEWLIKMESSLLDSFWALHFTDGQNSGVSSHFVPLHNELFEK